MAVKGLNELIDLFSNNYGICRHWLNGKCLYGENCKLYHIPNGFGMNKLSQRKYRKKNKNKDKRLRKKRRNCRRHSQFRYWLLDNFGRKLLNYGNGIIDVAGGKGILSFEFVNLNGINSCVIDPRNELELHKWIKALNDGYLHKNKMILNKYINRSYDECQRSGSIYPKHLKLYFDGILIEYIGNDGILDKLVEHQYNMFIKTNCEHNNGVLQSKGTKGIKTINHDLFNKDSLKERIRNDCIQFKNMVKQCSCLIGMHPDIATEYIVDMGLQYNIPFAIIPCCVFPNSFPKRKLRNGIEPRKYNQFCQYLCEKNSSINITKLDTMDGQNNIIWFKP